MTFEREVSALREHLARLARDGDPGFSEHGQASPQLAKRLKWYPRLRVTLGLKLRALGLRRPPAPQPWLPGLKHAEHTEHARALVLWALGIDREALREACAALQQKHLPLPGLAPVLVTDVADFAYFSRLGWLVEYVPALSDPAGGYAARKERYLAWLYRDSPALPITVGVADIETQALLNFLTGNRTGGQHEGETGEATMPE